MRKIIGGTALLFLLLAVLYSCGKPPEFIGLKNAKIIGLQDSLLLFDIDYIAFNPNRVTTKLKSSEIDVYYKNQWVGSGTISQAMSLPANDTIIAPVKCKLSLNKLHEFYPELMKANSAIFELRGFNKIGFAMLNLNNKVNQQISLNTRLYFEEEVRRNLNANKGFRIQKLAMSSLPGLGESAFNMEILIENALPFDYVIEDLVLQFIPENKQDILASWQLKEPLVQLAQSETSLPVNVTVNHLNVLKNSQLSWFFTQSAKLRVIGKMQVLVAGKSFEIPLNEIVAVGL